MEKFKFPSALAGLQETASKQRIDLVDPILPTSTRSLVSDRFKAIPDPLGLFRQDHAKMKPVKIVPDDDTNLCIALVLGIALGFMLAVLTGA